uniref:Uncharacterized protein n=1 Tax=Anguilla anguilla TaxID=7936 RepID=A0A0E9SFN9_ANGAN
MCLWNFINQKN